MPHVQEGSFLTLHYRLSGPQGKVVIDTFEQGQPATLSLGAGELSPAIEQRLIGLEEGTTTVIELAAGETHPSVAPRNMLDYAVTNGTSQVPAPGNVSAPGASDHRSVHYNLTFNC